MGTIVNMPPLTDAYFPVMNAPLTEDAAAAGDEMYCSECLGRGQLVVSRPGQHLAYATCRTCQGTGIKGVVA